MSLVFIGTPDFAVPSLRRLAADGHEISAVVTQPDRPAGRGRHTKASPVKQAALELGLPVLQPASLRDEASLAEIAKLQPEVMVAVAYGQILRPNFLAIPPKGVLNVHPSLLPRWRGASPVQAAILAGEIETGVTIMLMDAGMDSGPILAQERAPVDDDDTARTLLDRLSEHGARLLTETLPPWLAGALIPQPQDDDLATTCPLIRKEDGRIDWSQPAREIALRVRAFNPWPGAYTQFGTETLHIWRAHPIYDALDLAPGVVFPTPEAFAVHTGDGALEVLEAQRPSRRPLPAPELLRGMPTLIGSRLGA